MLAQWAEGYSFLLASFFFSNLGTTEQKSQEGLARALLHQILSQHRDTIPSALPHMWKELLNTGDTTLPSVAETQTAFGVVARNLSATKICIFVDGLDEFQGDDSVAISFLESLRQSPNIKIIVSSRPIPSCVAAFGGYPKLRPQDLTRNDITIYVQDVISQNAHMQRLIRRSESQAIEIIKDRVEKSSGVFLWVVLTSKALLRGLEDGDRILELRQRVEDLPPELEQMFQHILERVPLRHRQQGLRMLKTCFVNQQAGHRMTTLGLGLVDDYHSSEIHLEVLTRQQKRHICEDTDRRLRSRCGGLLELESLKYDDICLCDYVPTDHDKRRSSNNSRDGKHGEGHSDDSNHNCDNKSSNHDDYIDTAVVFLHRSVFEFLSDKNTWALVGLSLPNDRYHASVVLSLSGLQLSWQSLHLRCPNEELGSLFFEIGLTWAIRCERQHIPGRDLFFEHIQPLIDIANQWKTPMLDMANGLPSNKIHDRHPDYKGFTVLLLAIEAGATQFVRKHPDLLILVKHDREICRCMPVLYHAIKGLEFNQGLRRQGTSVDTVRLLLGLGCNPNEPLVFDRTDTPWRAWLDFVTKWVDELDRLEVLEIAEQFLQAGADPWPQIDVLDWLDRVFVQAETDRSNLDEVNPIDERSGAILKERAENLIRLIKEQRQRQTGLESSSSGYEEDITESDENLEGHGVLTTKTQAGQSSVEEKPTGERSNLFSKTSSDVETVCLKRKSRPDDIEYPRKENRRHPS
ncbi:hypothetical protein SCUP515_02423 [Seiridium cupressi]